MKLNYFSITVYIKGRFWPLRGIREYPFESYNKVEAAVRTSLLKFYYDEDIVAIDIAVLPDDADQVKTYLEKKRRVNTVAGKR